LSVINNCCNFIFYLFASPRRLVWFALFVAFEMAWYAIIPIGVVLVTAADSLVWVAIVMAAVFLVICVLYAMYVVIAVSFFLNRHPNYSLPMGDAVDFRKFLMQDVRLLF
jgi:hypothetical protein